MPKKTRIKGTTYHLVQPSYAEQLRAAREGCKEPPSAVWVTDAEFKRAQGTKSKHSNNNNNNNNNSYSDSVIDSATFMQNILNKANQNAMENVNYSYNNNDYEEKDQEYDYNNEYYHQNHDEYDENDWNEFEEGEEEEWEEDDDDDDFDDDNNDDDFDKSITSDNHEKKENSENKKVFEEHEGRKRSNNKEVEGEPEARVTLVKGVNELHNTNNNKTLCNKERYSQERKSVKLAKQQKSHITFSLHQENRSDLKSIDKNSHNKRQAMEYNDINKEKQLEDIITTNTTSATTNTVEHNMVDNNIDANNDEANRENSDEEDSDKLFDDEVECEITDEFLHTLVFGDGIVVDDEIENYAEEEENKNQKSDMMYYEREHNGAHYKIDEEVWNLMTPEERNAVQASHECGTARRRAQLRQWKPCEEEHEEKNGTKSSHEQYEEENEWQISHKSALETLDKAHHTSSAMLHGEDGMEFAHTHEDESGALESQFTKMMQEFNVDAAINDADYDDLRTHGPLSMTQYMGALEEFVKDRAGIDVQTAEPHKNKGLIQQLKLMSTRAGVFDTDGKGGVFRTTVSSDKDVRFAEEFQRETERIRAEAQKRVLLRNEEAERVNNHALESTHDKSQGENNTKKVMEDSNANDTLLSLPHKSEEQKEQENEGEEYTFVTIKSKHDRLDCETAISAYSNYYNQPNVIAPPQSSKSKKKKMQTSVIPHHASSEDTKVVDNNQVKLTNTPQSIDGVGTRADKTKNNNNTKNRKWENQYQEKEESKEEEKCELVSACFVRKENETKEERRLRQKAVKALQRERRREKAERKKVYKEIEVQELKREAASRAAKSTVHFT